MLMKVLPRSSAPISRSRFSTSRLTQPAAREPSFSSWCMRPRDTAVSAVSEPEKKAETTSRMAMAIRVVTSMAFAPSKEGRKA